MIQELKKSAFRNMQWTGLSSGIVSTLQLINTVVLVYFLRPDEFGTMSAMLLLIWFTQYISDGGMSPAIVHYDTNSPGIMNTLYAINIGLAVGLYVLVVVFAEHIARIYDEPLLVTYLPVAMLSMVVASFGNQFKVVLMKVLRFDVIARQEVITAMINSLVTILLAAMGYGVWAMVIGHLSGVVLGTVVLIALVSRATVRTHNASCVGPASAPEVMRHAPGTPQQGITAVAPVEPVAADAHTVPGKLGTQIDTG
jgi:O-antigen/teichoic acid export membrane protein